jgi:hypothetical protein
MNAAIAGNAAAFVRVVSATPALRAQRLVLLGTGTVGRAFVARYQRLVQ